MFCVLVMPLTSPRHPRQKHMGTDLSANMHYHLYSGFDQQVALKLSERLPRKNAPFLLRSEL